MNGLFRCSRSLNIADFGTNRQLYGGVSNWFIINNNNYDDIYGAVIIIVGVQ